MHVFAADMYDAHARLRVFPLRHHTAAPQCFFSICVLYISYIFRAI